MAIRLPLLTAQIIVLNVEGPSVPTPNFCWTLAFFRTYHPWITCFLYMHPKIGMMWSMTRLVSIACYDLHLKYLQGLHCMRLLLHSGFNRLYYQLKEATQRPWIIIWHALQWPGLFITILRENLKRKICAHRA